VHPLLSVTAFLFGLVLAGVPAALAGTCSAPDARSDCSADCTSLNACLHCCTRAHASGATCRAECSAVVGARRPVSAPRPAADRPQVTRQPSRPTRPAPRAPTRPRPAQQPPTEPTIDPSRLSASCHLDQAGDRVVVNLRVTNDTGADLRTVLANQPLVQVEAGARLSLGKVPSPHSYGVIVAGGSVSFRWQGRLGPAGAVGVSASASAVAPTGQSIDTPLADCGIAGQSQPNPPAPTDTTPEANPPTDTTTADSAVVAFVTSKWSESGHADTYGPAQGNTFCARCHSPLQADAGATETNNAAIPEAQWQDVTCSVCHPSAAQRAAWGSPIAKYDVATKTYESVPLADADVLCTHCHTDQFAPGFQGYGVIMHEAGVRCIDCHMAVIPAGDPNVGQWPAHDFKVAANLPYSCGTYPGGCHSRRPEAWARRILALGPLHAPQQGQ
jgi:hypothetical protein